MDLSEILRRVGAGSLLEELHNPEPPASLLEEADLPEPPEAEQEAAATPPQATAVEPSQKARQAGMQHEGNEESIDDYMARLMQRVRGTGGLTEPSAFRGPSPAASPAPEPPRAAEKNPVQEKPIETPVETPIFTPRPRREEVDAGPRAVAPERHSGLSAMRELANLSAQNALSNHARRQMIVSIRTKLVTMGMGLLAGGALLWLWRRPGANVMTLYAAAASFVVALVWGIQYAAMTGRLIVGKAGGMQRNGGRSSPPKPSAADAEKLSASTTDGNS